MTIIQKISTFFKKKNNFFPRIDTKVLQIRGFNPVIIISFLIIFSCVFFVTSNLIDKKNEKNLNNLKEISENNEFSTFTNFLISRINSPYQEISYIIKNNDTVEKILKKYKVQQDDIRNISSKLKQQKLTNIYSGRKLTLIIKKMNDGSNSVVNFVYPINNTTSVDIRKSQDIFIDSNFRIKHVIKDYKNNIRCLFAYYR